MCIVVKGWFLASDIGKDGRILVAKSACYQSLQECLNSTMEEGVRKFIWS